MVTTRRQLYLTSLVLFFALKLVLHSIVMQMQGAIHANDLSILLMLFLSLEDDSKSRIRSIWRYDRQQGFFKNQLLGSYTDQMFKDRLRINNRSAIKNNH